MRWILLIVCAGSTLAAQPVFVGIAGGTGCGKTTLAERIVEAFPDDCVLISQDSYYKELGHLPLTDREKTNFDHPDSIDFALMQSHLQALARGTGVDVPVYNFRIHNRESYSTTVRPAKIVLVEGILILSIPELRDLFDIKIFIDADDDVRVLRRVERDIIERARDFKSVQRQYLTTVKPMHDLFVEPSKQYADIIVPHGGKNGVALSIICSKMHDILSQREPQ
ncbi:MAG: uridine kinase [Chlamydiota bacterium]|jgi:uridine kinase